MKKLTTLLTTLIAAIGLGQSITIINQATAVVGPSATPYESNRVETVVAASFACIPQIEPNGSIAAPAWTRVANFGTTAILPYTVRNLGTAITALSLDWIIDAASTTTASAVRIVQDLNNNQQIDGGEPTITSINLAANQSASIILELTVSDNTGGNIYVTPRASCNDRQDANNYSLVQVGLAVVSVRKQVIPESVEVGSEAVFAIDVRNTSNRTLQGPIYVTDRFDLADLEGLQLIPASAFTPAGTVEFYVFGSWTSTIPAPENIQGVRLILASLGPGQSVRWTFRMQVSADAEPGARENLVSVTGEGFLAAQAVAPFAVFIRYEHHLGPYQNPRALPGGEASADDWQTVENAIQDQPVCFLHTLENPSRITDNYTIYNEPVPTGVELAYSDLDLTPRVAPFVIQLGPNQMAHFRLCITLRAGAPNNNIWVELVARSQASQMANRTWDRLLRNNGGDGIDQEKTSSVSGLVKSGDVVTYTITVRNKYPFTLTNPEIRDPLPVLVEFLSASEGGVFDNGQVVWRFPTLRSGEVKRVSVTTRLRRDVKDDANACNTALFQSQEVIIQLPSNQICNRVFTLGLLLEKTVNPTDVAHGDVVTYTLRVSNPSNAPLTVSITDTPAQGMSYVPGSSTPEPAQQNGQLVWSGLELAPGETRTITYKMRVLANAPNCMINVAQAKGVSPQGTQVESPPASAQTCLRKGAFAPANMLIGQVFLDVDGDGRFSPGTDAPMAGARLVLADGMQTVTDAQGRYAFRNLTSGLWVIILDSASTPFRPLPYPGADGFQRIVQVKGVSQHDIPLEAPKPKVSAIRETVLQFGPVRVEKSVVVLPDGGQRVLLWVSSRERLQDFTVTDPLPNGGEKVFSFDSFEGQRTLSYDIASSDPSITEPQVRWRSE